MKITTLQAAAGSVLLLLLQPAAGATHRNRHAHDLFSKRHQTSHGVSELAPTGQISKRATCTLPDHPDLVKVPGASNNGFAMSPDQSCLDGSYCPFACVPGKVMNQWKPDSKYTYPESMVSRYWYGSSDSPETDVS